MPRNLCPWPKLQPRLDFGGFLRLELQDIHVLFLGWLYGFSENGDPVTRFWQFTEKMTCGFGVSYVYTNPWWMRKQQYWDMLGTLQNSFLDYF